MRELREEQLKGLDAVEAATRLLQRVRNADPVDGLYEAAEIQWWWSKPRSTDTLPQLIWYDADDEPIAAAVVADFGDGGSLVYDEVILCPFVMPGSDAELIDHVVTRALAHAAEHGIESVELEVGRAETVVREVLARHGFTEKEPDAIEQGWLESDARPDISPLADGYRLASRADTAPRLHHLVERNPTCSEQRLAEVSLYRPDLDLVILDGHDEYAAYALFWFDPVTATGVVEPVRTKDDHQRRGLSRHVLTAGIDLLARAGAMRISIGWEPDNLVSGNLYKSLGFVSAETTDLFAGPTTR